MFAEIDGVPIGRIIIGPFSPRGSYYGCGARPRRAMSCSKAGIPCKAS